MVSRKKQKKSIWQKASDIFSTKSQHKSIIPNSHLGGYRTYVQEPGKPVWTPRAYDHFADEAYTKNVVAHRCVSLVSQSVASVGWKLADKSTGKTKQIEDHPLLRLLKNPNHTRSGREFIEAVISFRQIAGNSYIVAVGPDGQAPKELYSLRPDRVQIIAGHNGMAAGYLYKIGNKEIRYMIDPVSGKSSILHLKNFHPLDDYYGMSSIEAAAYSIDQHNQAGMWNQSLLQNGAKPSGALVVKSDEQNGGRLSDEQFNRIKSQMDEQYSGASNAGRPLLLEGGLDWKEMSLSPKDMDFIESKHSSARDIALAFGVPPQLLGIPGDNTYSNMIEARLALWEQTVLPILDSLATSFNNWLTPQFGGKLELSHNLDNVSALAPRREALWNRVGKAEFLSDEEKRKILGI